MPELLKLPHLGQENRVSEMQVRTRGIESCLHSKRSIREARLLKPIFEFRTNVEIDDASSEKRELFGDGGKHLGDDIPRMVPLPPSQLAVAGIAEKVHKKVRKIRKRTSMEARGAEASVAKKLR